MSVSARLRLLLACASAAATIAASAQQAGPPYGAGGKNAAQSGVEPDPSPEGRPATRELACIAPDAVTSDETPPDVYTGVRRCVAQGDFDHAAELFALAGAFGAFDGQRVADASARDAPQVLAYLLSGSLSPAQRTGLSEALARITTDTALKRQVCTAAANLEAPTYVPTYMIRHGMNAIASPASTADPFVPDFDAAATWRRVRTAYLGCAA